MVDLGGEPLAGAEVRTETGAATSGEDGTFTVTAPLDPSWVRVTSDGHLPRTEAGRPGAPLLSRLTPQDGSTVSVRFGGDVMAGRRYIDADEDGRPGGGLLPPHADADDHAVLLDDVAPILESADVTVVNLETALWPNPLAPAEGPRPGAFHPTKAIAYASLPPLAEGLAAAGVDVVDLANNHLFDVLEPGVEATLSAVDAAGLVRFGAGKNIDEAWRPARLDVRGQRLSFVGCTTVEGEDEVPMYVATDGTAGVAACERQRLQSAVAGERAAGRTVVAMVHGGVEYRRTHGSEVRGFNDVARDAGALLVVDHHPHVIGGVRAETDGSLTAETLGNLLFDQQVWSTFPSYLLSTDLRDGEVVRARTEPLVLQGYTPRGTVGGLADVSDRFAALLGAGAGTFGPGGAEIVPGGPVRLGRADAELAPGQVRRLAPGWAATTTAGPGFQVGQELLWTGGFEDEETGPSLGASLWDLGGSSVALRQDATHTGTQGVRMATSPAATAPTLLTTDTARPCRTTVAR